MKKQIYKQFSEMQKIQHLLINSIDFSIKDQMSRGSVFKLSGTMALGTNNTQTYSTTELQSIKSSLRLLKAKQSQKRSQQNIDINNYGNGNSISANNNRTSINRGSGNGSEPNYNYYQSNANNHIPQAPNNNYQNDFPTNNRQKYSQETQLPARNRNEGSFSKNDIGMSSNSRNNNYSNSKINEAPQKHDFISIKQLQQSNSRRHDRNIQAFNKQPQQRALQNSGRNRIESNYTDQSSKQVAARRQQIAPNYQAQSRIPLKKQVQNIPQPKPKYQQSNPYQNGNNFQDKAIKQINHQNKPEIVQYDPSSFVKCTAGCGRKFNPDSIDKHQAICTKVFMKKRKQFDTQEQRIVDNQHQNIIKNHYQEKKPKKNNANQQKMSKWKAQSLAFRSMLKQGNGNQLTAQQKQQAEQALGKVKCQFCGRTFSDTAGPKHIIFCEAQSKKQKLKR